MKKNQIILVASLGVLLSACASNSPNDKAASEKVVKVKDERVCTAGAARTGSRLKKKSCRSK